MFMRISGISVTDSSTRNFLTLERPGWDYFLLSEKKFLYWCKLWQAKKQAIKADEIIIQFNRILNTKQKSFSRQSTSKSTSNREHFNNNNACWSFHKNLQRRCCQANCLCCCQGCHFGKYFAFNHFNFDWTSYLIYSLGAGFVHWLWLQDGNLRLPKRSNRPSLPDSSSEERWWQIKRKNASFVSICIFAMYHRSNESPVVLASSIALFFHIFRDLFVMNSAFQLYL